MMGNMYSVVMQILMHSSSWCLGKNTSGLMCSKDLKIGMEAGRLGQVHIVLEPELPTGTYIHTRNQVLGPIPDADN